MSTRPTNPPDAVREPIAPRLRARALGILTVCVAGGVLLTGCVPAGGVAAPKTTAASPRATTKPPKPRAENPPEKVSRAESGYTWANSQNVGLPSDPTKPAFLNQLAASPEWEAIPESTRTEDGQWAYRSKANGCQVSLFQGKLTDVPLTGRDDRAYTLDIYHQLLGEHFAAVQDQITDSRISYGVNKLPQPGDPAVEGLSLVDGSTSIWARGFTSIGLGMLVAGMCLNPADLPAVTDTIHQVGVVDF